MKLLLVTAVAEFQKEVLKLFKKAQIEAFSSSDIDGYKKKHSLLATQTWFPHIEGGNESVLFFSFTDESKIEDFCTLTKVFNKTMETNNPVRAVIINIEKYI
ncbi:MAG: hypothetical protein WBL21_09500 [Salinimicrobium sp.]